MLVKVVLKIGSFTICVYVSTVDALRKDCKYVDLSLIPRPVVSLFQRLKQRKGPIPNPEMDWSRIEPKLSSTLMRFQREGVEYVHEYCRAGKFGREK